MEELDTITKEDYMLVNEAYFIKHTILSKALLNTDAESPEKICTQCGNEFETEFLPHLSIVMFYDIKQIEILVDHQLIRRDICVSWRNFSCFTENASILSEKLLVILNPLSAAMFPVKCSEILQECHYEKECSTYFNTAIKFLLKAIDLIGVSEVFESNSIWDPNFYRCLSGESIRFSDEVSGKLCQYLMCGNEIALSDENFLRVIKTFCGVRNAAITFLYIGKDHLVRLLDISRRKKIWLPGIFMKNFDLTNTCLRLHRLKKFFTLLFFGARNKYSIEECQEIRHEVTLYLLDEGEDISGIIKRPPEIEFDVFNFRCYQVLLLYLLSTRSPMNLAALKMLWCTIPDSFLTRKDFFRIYATIPLSMGELLKCKEWYDENIVGEMWLVRQPRSLKHLARCTIRKSLAENCSLLNYLPMRFNYPESLKNYVENLSDAFNFTV